MALIRGALSTLRKGLAKTRDALAGSLGSLLAGKSLDDALIREIEKQLEPVFKQVRDSGGFDLILNNVPGVVVMISEQVDITQQVIDALAAAGSGS